MKANGHPENPYATITCACGNRVVTRSTRGDFVTEVCGACHPFYTGKQKVIDTAGRVDRFKKRLSRAGTQRTAKAEKASKAEA